MISIPHILLALVLISMLVVVFIGWLKSRSEEESEEDEEYTEFDRMAEEANSYEEIDPDEIVTDSTGRQYYKGERI